MTDETTESTENASGLRDYKAWHQAYDEPGSSLHLRLLVVQDLISGWLDGARPGPLRVVSVCAGQGRDIAGVVRRHRRGHDLRGRLVELDPGIVEDARRLLADAGADGIEVVPADAAVSDAYEGAAPADLVLVCGVFGNIVDDDIERTIRFLPRLCAPGASVVWTRYTPPAGIIDRIDGWFAAAGFERVSVVVSEAAGFGVGMHRLAGEPQPFESGRRLFTFIR